MCMMILKLCVGRVVLNYKCLFYYSLNSFYYGKSVVFVFYVIFVFLNICRVYFIEGLK